MSQTLKKLNEERGAKLKAREELRAKIEAENRVPTAEEISTSRSLNDEYERLSEAIFEESRSLSNSSQSQGLSRQDKADIAKFSLGKLVRHIAAVRDGHSSPIDGIEAEMIAEGQNEAREARVQMLGFALPSMIVRGLREQRDLSVTGGTTDQYGGALVQTDVGGVMGDFYHSSVAARAGATVITGLTNNLSLPRYNSATDPAHKSENAAADELSPTFTSLELAPKRLPAAVDVSDLLMLQTSALEQFLRIELEAQLRAVQEVAFFHGTGSTMPTGIGATVGIGLVTGGTNGAAPDRTDIINLYKAVAAANAGMGRLAFVTNDSVLCKLAATPRLASTDSRMVIDDLGTTMLEGKPFFSTNAVSSTLTKGSATSICSAIFYGDFSKLVIGYWGGLMIDVTRDSTQAKAGLRSVVCNQYYDAGVRSPESFAWMKDALTA